jgi:hypothetical protein
LDMYKSPVRTIRTCKILRLNTVRLHNGVSRNLHSHVSWEPQKRQKVVEAWCRAGVTTAGVEVPRPSGQRDTACACGSLSRTDGRYTSKYLTQGVCEIYFPYCTGINVFFPLEQFALLFLPPLAPQIAFHLPEACLASLRATERYSLLLRHIPRSLGLSPATEDLLSELSKVYVTLFFLTYLLLSHSSLLPLDYTSR